MPCFGTERRGQRNIMLRARINHVQFSRYRPTTSHTDLSTFNRQGLKAWLLPAIWICLPSCILSHIEFHQSPAVATLHTTVVSLGKSRLLRAFVSADADHSLSASQDHLVGIRRGYMPFSESMIPGKLQFLGHQKRQQ
jgi:hypothetical protein